MHRGIKPKAKKEEEFDRKFTKELLAEIRKKQKEIKETEDDKDEENSPKLDDEEKNQLLKKRTENMRNILAKQTIELVEKPVYHEASSNNTKTNVSFKKRNITNAKRKVPEKDDN